MEENVIENVEVQDDPYEIKMLANLKKMIRTANNAAEKMKYDHGEIELGAIRRVMEANSIISIPPGTERIIGAYYERVTGRKAYY
ncbi:hypothetical protein [Bacillus sp. FJAT-49736]|uniref:hypothetical protein n=1 Tax=Bacillus sp. FJAT-49736 TaxID=2833582 RepID=UPI001BC9DD41|nr:hypothetical protein [Bacillus sp. FJAT-49736]MBS4173505.1 hypothetical protein [Bacillus sp. FJAT-49736]